MATANQANSVSDGLTLGYDYYLSELISTYVGLGYNHSDTAVTDTSDYESYDFNYRLNFNFPWAYVSVGEALTFSDYKIVDPSTNSNIIPSTVTNVFDFMISKPIGDILPIIDPNKELSVTLSYDKTFSEGNLLNNDYIADSFTFGLAKSINFSD